ncbi:hypothetical protein [Pseudomonas sp. ATCC PTA-122608]|uniref:hypothetical protein n=1 Tax=Pseudomonas sp. ATCC PTA-122608 TaxID=1771311 RepID=UPI0013563F3A|nr:hypothetical protein [Pseudomonas sp. ATCC PTA-122608]
MKKSHEQIEQEIRDEIPFLRKMMEEGGLIEEFDVPEPETQMLGYPPDLIIN